LKKSYNQVQDSSGLGKIGCIKGWLDLRLRLIMDRKKLRKSRLKVKLIQVRENTKSQTKRSQEMGNQVSSQR
jgi:hypothetical protein